MNTIIPLVSPPTSEAQLMKQAHQLSGYNLGELSALAGLPIPKNLKYNKGWVGMLLELWLGANAGNKAKPDFVRLGIELKTVPIDSYGRSLETTFVCSAPLTKNSGITWKTSYVRHKLKRVLWVPIEGTKEILLSQRRIGTPLLWSPNKNEEKKLQRDWEELMDLIVLGQVERITAHYGEVLQLRPKAANKKVLTEAIGMYGEPIFTSPLGFYLKKKFTSELLIRYCSFYDL